MSLKSKLAALESRMRESTPLRPMITCGHCGQRYDPGPELDDSQLCQTLGPTDQVWELAQELGRKIHAAIQRLDSRPREQQRPWCQACFDQLLDSDPEVIEAVNLWVRARDAHRAGATSMTSRDGRAASVQGEAARPGG